jgi:hypothetical protein
MIERLDSYESGVIYLATLADDLRGLVAASELRDEHLVDGFWDHFQEIDMVLELRTEPSWALPESDASDVRLREWLDELRAWVSGVLADADDGRT